MNYNRKLNLSAFAVSRNGYLHLSNRVHPHFFLRVVSLQGLTPPGGNSLINMWSQDEFPSNARVVSVEFDDGFAFLSQQRNKYNIPNHTFQSRYDLRYVRRSYIFSESDVLQQ